MQDAQEQEASRRMIKGKSSQTGPSEMAGIAFMSERATRAGKVEHLISKPHVTSFTYTYTLMGFLGTTPLLGYWHT
jgi:hypothetical protein